METMFKVPIRNLFCLLSYVNEMPDLVESLSDVDENLITYDFITNQFLQEVQLLHRSGLIKNYVIKRESTSHLGGRVMMNDSMPFIVGRQPIVVCEKDQYSANILLNQVMKSTLKAICFNHFIKEETRKRSFTYMEYMPEADALPITSDIFSRIYFGRHDVRYKRMIHIARLLHELTLLSHKHGNWSLFNAELDETALNQIFEKFLFHFYRIEQQDYQVASETLRWKLDGSPSFLPSMKTDVSLTHKNRQQKVIMDAKFYKNVFQRNFGKASFHSHNMYQLFTYLMHQPKDLCLRGILIYPFNGVEVDETFTWDERMTMEVLTLNLNDSWKEIYRKLIRVLER
ncbi:McrC family protein [Neobacillus sp. 19]|uniref:McrC family protein n=1 Tax=Neobacillus sp. 19 TaxID=3394458 RepID=UPI003BF71DE9